jgi:NADPH-dependent curcumin reductase CurA
MTQQNRQWLLARRPQGEPQLTDFELVESPVSTLQPGQVLLRAQYLSLDPYMRGRMNEGRSYVQPVALGAVMCGETVSEVVESRNERLPVGTFVRADLGWQDFAVSDGAALRVVDLTIAPASIWLSVLGMPAITAHIGLLDIGQPKAGETVVVSAAAGAVGSMVGQIAKIKGCHTVGIAGGAAKCDYGVRELGFDACLDYKTAAWRDALKQATPRGIDVYFDNVGGEILDAVLGRMNPFSRLPLCGLISQYNATEAYGIKNFRSILVNRIRVQGFIVFDRPELWSAANTDLIAWYRAGQLKHREWITSGLENAPRAFIGLLRGENLGKALVKIV